MIALALRVDIESYALEMRRSNPLYLCARDGTLTSSVLTRYLTNVHYMISRTPACMMRAAKRSRELGDEKLAAHYDVKADDERGHDAWAERDLERVGGEGTRPLAVGVAPAVREQLNHIEAIIDRDPVLYLAYTLFAEYLVVLMGGEWLKLLETNCGIPTSSMTVIGNHVELDKHHVEEALDTIDALVGDPTKLPAMRAALAQTISIFDRFCHEVTGNVSELSARVSAA